VTFTFAQLQKLMGGFECSVKILIGFNRFTWHKKQNVTNIDEKSQKYCYCQSDKSGALKKAELYISETWMRWKQSRKIPKLNCLMMESKAFVT